MIKICNLTDGSKVIWMWIYIDNKCYYIPAVPSFNEPMRESDVDDYVDSDLHEDQI